MYCCERFDYFDQGKLIEIIENKSEHLFKARKNKNS